VQLVDVDHLLRRPLLGLYLAAHQRAVIVALLLRQPTGLRVRRQTAGANNLARDVDRNGDLGALRFVDEDGFTIGLGEPLRRQR
jgi:hypothetical protein